MSKMWLPKTGAREKGRLRFHMYFGYDKDVPTKQPRTWRSSWAIMHFESNVCVEQGAARKLTTPLRCDGNLHQAERPIGEWHMYEAHAPAAVTSSLNAPGVPYLGVPRIFSKASIASPSPLHRNTLPLAHPLAGLTTDSTPCRQREPRSPLPSLPSSSTSLWIVSDLSLFGT